MSNFDQVAAALDAANNVHLYALCGGQIWTCTQQSGGWSNWSLTPPPPDHAVTGVAAASDNSQVYGTFTDGVAATAPGSSSWSWLIAGPPYSKIAAAVIGPPGFGLMTQLFYAGSGGAYTLANGNPLSLSNAAPTALAACTDPDGHLFCFLADGTAGLTVYQQIGGFNGSWSASKSSGQPSSNAIQGLAAAPISTGVIVFASDSNGNGFYSKMTQTNGQSDVFSFSAWQDLPKPQPIKALALAPLADGKLQLFAIDDEGHLWNCVFDPATSSSPSWQGPLQLVIPVTATVAINESDLESSTWSYSSNSNSPNLAGSNIKVDTSTAVIYMNLQLAEKSTGSIAFQDPPVAWTSSGTVPVTIENTDGSTATFLVTNAVHDKSYGFKIQALYTPAGGGAPQKLTSPDPTIVNNPIDG